MYKNQPAFETKLNFSFIQDLISYTWNVRAFFNQSTGYLMYLRVDQTQSLWGVPETIGIILIAIFSIIMYNVIKFEFQKKFNERQTNIINAKLDESKEMARLSGLDTEAIDNISKDSQFDVGPSENDKKVDNEKIDEDIPTNKPKKLSWEEYKKLEEGE